MTYGQGPYQPVVAPLSDFPGEHGRAAMRGQRTRMTIGMVVIAAFFGVYPLVWTGMLIARAGSEAWSHPGDWVPALALGLACTLGPLLLTRAAWKAVGARSRAAYYLQGTTLHVQEGGRTVAVDLSTARVRMWYRPVRSVLSRFPRGYVPNLVIHGSGVKTVMMLASEHIQAVRPYGDMQRLADALAYNPSAGEVVGALRDPRSWPHLPW